MSDDAERAPMTIKGVPTATRHKMIGCARKQGQTVAEWLAQAVDMVARIQDGERVFPPGQPIPPPAPNPANAPPAVYQGNPGMPGTPGVDFGALAVTLRAALAIADATGVAVPKAAARQAMTLLTEQLRVARGLPARIPRQTKPRPGQT